MHDFGLGFIFSVGSCLLVLLCFFVCLLGLILVGWLGVLVFFLWRGLISPSCQNSAHWQTTDSFLNKIWCSWNQKNLNCLHLAKLFTSSRHLHSQEWHYFGSDYILFAWLPFECVANTEIKNYITVVIRIHKSLFHCLYNTGAIASILEMPKWCQWWWFMLDQFLNSN